MAMVQDQRKTLKPSNLIIGEEHGFGPKQFRLRFWVWCVKIVVTLMWYHFRIRSRWYPTRENTSEILLPLLANQYDM